MMDYGHWILLCDELDGFQSFVYRLTDENGKMYIGAKTVSRGWKKYKSSSRFVKEAMNNGMVFKYEILELFEDKFGAFAREDELLSEFDCVRSSDYYNRLQWGKDINKLDREVSTETRSKISASMKKYVEENPRPVKEKSPRKYGPRPDHKYTLDGIGFDSLAAMQIVSGRPRNKAL